MESMKSSSPKFHEDSESLKVSTTVSSNSDVSLGKPLSVTNPTGLKTSPLLNPCPYLAISKESISKADGIPTVLDSGNSTSPTAVVTIPTNV